MVAGLGDLNVSLIISGLGSALGCGIAGLAGVGAWKKAYAANKAAPMFVVAYVAMPLLQVLLGMIIQQAFIAAKMPADTYLIQMYLGATAGFALAVCSVIVGLCAAKACDALCETGKGSTNYLMILGSIEAVSIIIMVFCLKAIPKAAAVAAAVAH